MFKLLLGLDINIIREVLSGGGKAQTYIQKLLQTAKEQQSDYDKSEFGAENA